jgi:hypothetical protein
MKEEVKRKGYQGIDWNNLRKKARINVKNERMNRVDSKLQYF